MKIVIDTNALESARYAKRPVAAAARRGAAAGDFELVIPEAAIADLVKHFPVQLQATGGALKKRQRELATFGLETPAMGPIDASMLAATDEAALGARCSEPGCRVKPSRAETSARPLPGRSRPHAV